MTGRDFARRRARIMQRGRGAAHERKALAHLAREAGAVAFYSPGGKLQGHVMPDGFVVCEKRRYPDLAAAQRELTGARAFAHLQENRIPVRAYPCNCCGGWHLSSKA